LEFARQGVNVALLARNAARLEAAAQEVRGQGVGALPIVTDVADADAVEAAAARVEGELGAIDVWVNNAMATVFAPIDRVSPEEFRRATEVTYLGQVYGTMAALARMRKRDSGTIVNVGSALAYRAIPLQSAYCGAKYAVRGFTDGVRTELIHDGSAIRLVMVHLPAVNTPQFDWALNKLGKRPQPVPPIFQPEVPARAIVEAALNPDRREVWVGMPTVMTILANKLAPGLLDRYLARRGYSGQLTDEPVPNDAPANLFKTADGDYGAHGRFDSRARNVSYQAVASRHRGALTLGLLGLGCLGLTALLTRPRDQVEAKL
jgi:NAD(P)-dependent dehydrogenase (short-subunit alcohol dehydrogenase family)